MEEKKRLYCEQIEHEVIMLMRRADFKRTMAGSPPTMDRSAYLLLKWLEQEGDAAIGEIADVFQLDNSTISRQISSLEKKGWAERYTDPADARVSKVHITEAGRTTINEAKAQRQEIYGKLLEDWTEEELQTFSTLFARLNRSIERYRRLR
ncbi:MarR family winged helix-turn-helix transcriptional regulator [Brevibacillus fulvus]|uniref:DNA-binding MarR family transcriptional regulator n=1 Tax=Brevibacillus fulvus TaxID=1125967 RepID=A0A938XSI8_9BACL|nr:MarR family transcriptional regulator [Brevibacillus fulvus]MBM7589598.1 DNA-binding MarR family transcriptional regulator [Brevibacillus fulvus]